MIWVRFSGSFAPYPLSVLSEHCDGNLFSLSRRKAIYQIIQNGVCRGDDKGLCKRVAVLPSQPSWLDNWSPYGDNHATSLHMGYSKTFCPM